ncbi:MAG: nucleotide-binding protein [Chloroflexi bacterium]|nr:nucleotide-binding protein [Chloroflexota bacterium]
MVDRDKLFQLRSFLDDLKEYRGLFEKPDTKQTVAKRTIPKALRLIFSEGHPYDYVNKEDLREHLVRETGALKDKLIELSGKEFYVRSGTSYSIWSTAFNKHVELYHQETATDFCIDATNEAIGKLESDIAAGVRDARTGCQKAVSVELSVESPTAFISHGKESNALTKTESFLRALGIEPLIVKDQASLDKDLGVKINHYLGQADFVVILATGDDKIEDKLCPRQNVIHEIGLAQGTHAGKIIYLLEEGAEFPSNIRPKVWQTFRQENMENAFERIAIELREMKILKAVKPE